MIDNIQFRQENTKEDNNNQREDNQISTKLKEISYQDYFLKKKDVTCCFCKCYNAYQKLMDLADKKVDLEKWAEFQINGFCTCCNAIHLCILYSIIDIIFNVFLLYFSFYLHPFFKNLKNNLRKLQNDNEEDWWLDWLDNDGADFSLASIQPKYDLWYNLSKFEIGSLLFSLIILVLFVIFCFLQTCKYYKIINEEEKRIGKTTIIILSIVILFFVLFLVIFLIWMNLFLFTILASISLKKEFLSETNYLFMSFKVIAYIFICFFSIFLFVCLKSVITIYLDLNYEENKNKKYKIKQNDDINDNYRYAINHEKDKIKGSYLFIGGKNENVTINSSKSIYLEESIEKNKKSAEKLYEFKQIRLNRITDHYLYILIKNDAYKNMLSITDWRFNQPEELYDNLSTIVLLISSLIILFSVPLYFHANDEQFYFVLKAILKKDTSTDISYKGIFMAYGDFEKSFVIIRFSLYILIDLGFILLMIKRVFYGGYIIIKLLNYSNKIFISLNILNVIIMILNIILIVFSIMCNTTELQIRQKYDYKTLHTNVFYIQHYYSYFCLIDMIIIIYKINCIRKIILAIKNDFDSLEKNEKKEDDKYEYQFTGLDSKVHTLYEVQVEGHPRHLYYNIKDINQNSNNENIIDNKIIKVEQDKNIDSKNDLNFQEQKTENDQILSINKLY